MITLTLPYPISTNRFKMPILVGKKPKQHIAFVDTPEAKAYKAEVLRRVRVAGIRAPIIGRIRLVARLYPHKPLDAAKRMRDLGDAWDDSVQCLDLDNALKVAIDAIKNVVIDDDKWIRSIAADRMEPDGESRLVLEVHPIVVEPKQLALDDEFPIAVPRRVAVAGWVDPFKVPA